VYVRRIGGHKDDIEMIDFYVFLDETVRTRHALWRRLCWFISNCTWPGNVNILHFVNVNRVIKLNFYFYFVYIVLYYLVPLGDLSFAKT